MTIRARLAAALLALPVLAAVATAPPASAATAYTWNGSASGAWGNATNWTPNGVPGSGDTVSIGPVPGTTAVTGAPATDLAALTVSGAVSLTGTGLLQVGNLQWTGGTINTDVYVGTSGVSHISSQQTPLRFGSSGLQTLTVAGQLTIAGGPGAATSPDLELMFDSDLRIAPTGAVQLGSTTRVAANRCCTNHTSTVVVDGTLTVAPPSTGDVARLEELGLDWAGAVEVPPLGTLQLVGGPVRVGSGAFNQTAGSASLAGGGTLDVVETDGASFDPVDPSAPDGTFKFVDPAGGSVTVSDGTTLRLGDFTETSGVGTITGDGELLLAGADLRGSLMLGSGVPARTVAGTVSRTALWDDEAGQYGVLTPGGDLTVVPGSTLTVISGTRVVVPDGARLTAQGGSTIDSGSCCTSPGRVTVSSGGTFAIGGGTPEEVNLQWFELGGSGLLTHVGTSDWDLAGTAFTAGARFSGTGTIDSDFPAGALRVTPVGLLTVDGDYLPSGGGTYAPTVPISKTGTVAPSRLKVTGTARLAGTLAARGTTDFATGHQVLALEAGSISGRFRCTTASGLVPRYTATAVRLEGIDVRPSGCLTLAEKKLLGATFGGQRKLDAGVPGAAGRVLLKVTLGKASKANTLTISGGTGRPAKVTAGKGRSITRYVVVPLSNAGRLTLELSQRAKVTVQRVGWL